MPQEELDVGIAPRTRKQTLKVAESCKVDILEKPLAFVAIQVPRSLE